MVELAQAALWHRQVAALVAAADRAGVGEHRLPAIRARLVQQRDRLTSAAHSTGQPAPALDPTPTEIAAAAPALADLSDEAVDRALSLALSTLDATESAVDGVAGGGSATAAPPTPSVPPPHPPIPIPPAPVPVPVPPTVVAGSVTSAGLPAIVHNGLIYSGYALAVLIIQVALLAVLDEERTLPLLAPFCLFVLPAFAWSAGWVTIAATLRPSPAQPSPPRHPRLGLVICALPNLLLCAGLGVLFAIR